MTLIEKFSTLSSNVLFKKVILLTIWIIFCTFVFYIFFREKNNWNIGSEDENLTLTDLFYFSTVTAFTVGYGDISPKRKILKYLVMFKIYISFIIVSL